MKSPNRRFSIDDELFAIALAIPALFGAARYFDTERERIALARLQGARTAAVAKALASQKGRMDHDSIVWGEQPGAAHISTPTPWEYFMPPLKTSQALIEGFRALLLLA